QEFQEDYLWNMWPKFEQTLTFDRQFDMHQVTLLAGMSADRYGRGRTLTVYGTNLPNNNLKNIELAQDSQINNEDIRESAGLSYFGRLNYSLANKYLLTAIIRRDGSDKFSPDYTWGTFPSVSAAWKLHEEGFIQNTIPAISNLKLRGGWGVVGIDAIDAWQYLSLIHSVGMSYPVGLPGGESLMPGATIKALASPDIKWEEATTTNVGLDFGMWNNRLTMGVDYFTKETKDILVDVPTSPSMGLGLAGGNEGGNRIANAATTINKGIELLLGYNNYSGDFKYGVSANFTYVTNEVTGLGEGEPIIGPTYNGQSHMTYTQIDYPIGAFYGYRVDKVYESETEVQNDNAAAAAATGDDVQYYQSDMTEEGDIRFKDLDNNGYIDDNDREVIGSPIPKYTYGLAFDAEWRGFDFSMNVSGIADVEIYSAFYTWNLLGMRLTSNHLAEVNDRWTENNRVTDMPRAIANDPNNNLRTSDRYIYDGSFLKVRNISLGYTLPASITNSVGVFSLRLFGTVQNALTISDYIGYDPEVGSYNEAASGYNLGRGIDRGFVPNPRTFLFGVEVSF
ncbi:MAG: SusC/RagA family TonB-linked outer membrane protein, partial [Bacteroidota bacterium]